MTSSVSLLSGLEFNQRKSSIQEGMQDRGVIDKSTTNYDYDIDMISKNRISQSQIQDNLKVSEENYNNLIDRFNTVKNQLNNGIKKYAVSKLDQGNKTATSNVLVTEPGNVTIKDISYEGCYNDKSTRAIDNLQPEGYVFNVDACAQRAIDVGKTVFGVQDVDGDGVGQCFIGDDLESAKQYDQAYNTKHYWYASGKGGYVRGGKTIKLFNNGVMMMFTTDDVSTDETDVLYSTYRDGNGKMSEGCNKDTGGTIQNVVASYGMNCLGGDYTSTSETEAPHIGNYTPYFKQIMGMDKGLYNIKFEKGDPAKGCQKDFDATYTCGDGPVKTIAIPGPSDGKPVIMDCSAESKQCGGIRMIMQNDGNLVILDGNDMLLWQSGTGNSNNIGDTPINDWLSNTLNGRDYLKAGEIMKPGDILASKNGKNMLTFDNGGYLILIKSDGDKCSVINGQSYGTSYSNAVYTLQKSNIDNLGKMAYIDDSGNKYLYNDINDLDDTNFITIGTYNSYDSDITSFSATEISQCEEAASKNPDCGGFIFNKQQQRCFLKGRQIWPKAQRVLDKDCLMVVKAPKVIIDKTCSDRFNGTTSSQFELYPNSGVIMSPTQKCGLGKFVDENQKAYDKENIILMNELEQIITEINTLSQQRDSNIALMPSLRSKIEGCFNDYNALKKEYRRYNDPTLSQYKKDTELKRNMYGTDTTLLALLGLGGLLLSMRLMK